MKSSSPVDRTKATDIRFEAASRNDVISRLSDFSPGLQLSKTTTLGRLDQ